MSPEQLIDAARVARFRADLERLTDAPTPAAPLGVAVSGGSDSFALLLLAWAAYPDAIIAATVDHQLRLAAAEEARYVGRFCIELGVRHETLRLNPNFNYDALSNLQDRARAIRYRCLHDWAEAHGIRHVAVAHHLDDVAEGFLMRAARGAGVAGLAAMRATRLLDEPSGTAVLVRPLLGWERTELAALVLDASVRPVLDPTNDDDRFDRTRMRRLLRENVDLPPERLARAASNLRDAEDALEWIVLRELKSRFEEDAWDGLWLRADDLPFELKRRFVTRAIEGVRQENGVFDKWRVTAVPDLVRLLDAGRGGTVAGIQARVLKGRWHFRPAPPRRATRKHEIDGPK